MVVVITLIKNWVTIWILILSIAQAGLKDGSDNNADKQVSHELDFNILSTAPWSGLKDGGYNNADKELSHYLDFNSVNRTSRSERW